MVSLLDLLDDRVVADLGVNYDLVQCLLLLSDHLIVGLRVLVASLDEDFG